MKIAVAYAQGLVFQHFGHSQQFKIYEIQAGEIRNEQVIDADGCGHGAMAALLAEQGVNMLICGGIGGCALTALAQAGIVVMGGVMGDADDAVEAFLAGELRFNPNAGCSHHGGDHSCDSHGCGSHCGHCG